MIWVFRFIGWIRIRGSKNFPQNQNSVLLVSNHPSLWEPIILTGLFFPQYVFHPIRRIPWGTPDQHNYTDKWYWAIFSARMISVPRGKRRGELRALVDFIKVLRTGGSVVLFAEGGRTAKGDHFLYSRSGKRMRELKHGVGRVVCRSSCLLFPVWIDGAEKVLPIGTWFPRVWRGMTITFGEPIHRERMDKPRKADFQEATVLVAEALLKTAD
jgi:1-acyl-sn-glycerol-3-phosphate acyltransferase